MSRLRQEYLALLGLLDEQAAVTECDLQGRITRVNRRFEQLSGYAAAELVGQDHRLLASGRHDKAFWQAVWTRLQAGKTWHGELCNRARDGRLFWEDTVIAPLPGPDGRPARYIAVRRDISAAKRAEAQLARAGQLAGVGGWVLDRAQQHLQLSEECRRILGADTPARLKLDEAARHFSAADWQTLRQHLESAARLHRPFDCVLRLHSSITRERWVRVVGETEPGEALVVGALQDISALTLAQRQAESSERTLRSAIEALGEAFALYDPDERLLFCNERYRELCGAPQRRMLTGLRFEEVLDLARHNAHSGPVLGEPMAWRAELLDSFRRPSSDTRHLLRDGRWIRAIMCRTADGLHVVFLIDITDSHRQLEAAGAAARSKSQFLANMSHEIRTPLNAVLGMLQLLAHTRLDSEQGELLEKAEGAARHLLGLLNSILDYSRAEAGQMLLDPQPFQPARLLRELRTLLSANLGGKPLALAFDADPRLPAWLLGDALRLQQVLINLGGNAIKFTARGTVRLAVALREERDEMLAVEFSVSDTGIGITPAQQRGLFEAFSQAEASTSRRYGGSGLGLAISQRLVQLMGGRLQLHSEPGRGSRFFFTLRLARAAPPPIAPPRPRAPGGRLRGLRLLLVEDNPLNREVALKLLRHEGAQVDSAEDGEQGLAALRAADYDLVLMDMQMPGLDGLQATRAIRREPRWACLPVLAMTANASPADREACLAAGMNGHVGKPFDLDQLVAAILALQQGTPPVFETSAPGPDLGALPCAVLDSERALGRLGQDRVFYAGLLRDFAPSAQRLVERLLTRGDRDAAHQLRSNAAALGMQRLTDACAAAEAAAQGALDAAGLHRELAAALQAGADWLAAHGEQAPAPQAGRAAPELGTALQALAESLERDALDCFERYDALVSAHGDALGAALQPLREAMARFDTEAAAAACRALACGAPAVPDTDPTPPLRRD